MMDVLDAPVPFLVGLLVGSNACPQPQGVVVCDLDQDIVHLGTEDDCRPPKPRFPPQLPRNLVSILKKELEDIADPLYLIPPSGAKGRITSDVHGLLNNDVREPYAHMFQVRSLSLTNTHRQYVLTKANYVQRDLLPLKQDDFVLFPEEEQTLYKSINPKKSSGSNSATKSHSGGNFMIKAIRRQGRAIQAHTDRALSFTAAGAARYDEEMEKKKDSIASAFYDVDQDLADSIRFSFLRFFSTLFRRYKEFTISDSSFRHEDFVNSMEEEMTYENRLFVLSVVKTQMFERFMVESSTRRRLFDELILVQENHESMISLPGMKKKHDTPFLDEKQQKAVKKIIIPAAPCSAGVPRDTVFEYDDGFPLLKEEEMVANKTLDPVSALCYVGNLMFCGVGVDW